MFKQKEKLSYDIVRLYLELDNKDINDFNKDIDEDILDYKGISEKTKDYVEKKRQFVHDSDTLMKAWKHKLEMHVEMDKLDEKMKKK